MSGADAGPSEGADRHAGRQHRDDPGDVEKTLGGDKGEIGERDRQRSLGETVAARPGDDGKKRPAGDHPEDRAAEEGADEFDGGGAEDGRPSRDDDAEQDRIEDDRGRIVEERLALDEPAQAGGRADVAEDRDDRGGIGGRDHRAEQGADRQRNPGERPERQAHDGGRDDCRDDRQHQDRSGVLEDAAHFAGKPGFEDQQREEEVNERLRAQRQIGEGAGDLAEPFRERAMDKNGRSRADRRADHGEEDDRRQPQPGGERLAERDDDEQAREHGQDENNIEHGFPGPLRLRAPHAPQRRHCRLRAFYLSIQGRPRLFRPRAISAATRPSPTAPNSR